MSNTTALIASITTIEEACTAFGYGYLAEDHVWYRKDKATIANNEMKFGIPKKVRVEEMAPIDILDHGDDDDRNFWIPVLSIQQNAKGRTRYLSPTSIPFDIEFPTDFRTLTHYDYDEPNGGVMFVGSREGHEWMVFDESDRAVKGFASGTFVEMFERFVNATPIELEMSFLHHLRALGADRLRDLHQQAVARAKQEAAIQRKRTEARIQRRLDVVSKGLMDIHDSLEDIIKVAHIGASEAATITYRIVYMADHQVEREAENNTNDTTIELYDLMKMHGKSKRLGEIAWVYRTVNNQSVPYAIWNPSSQLWELL